MPRSPRALRVAALACASALAAGATACGTAAAQGEPAPTGRPAAAASSPPTPAPTTSTWHVPAGANLIAFARRPVVVVRGLVHAHRKWRLTNPNAVGAPLVFLVVGQRAGAWAVRVPARPNDSVGWVRRSDVRVEIDPYVLRVSLHRHRLTVLRYGHKVRTFPVGVGRPDAPTPTGSFYLTELLKPRSTQTPYGPYAYGTSAFSDVYSEFEGGPGQIGVHGTSDPSSIGRNVSHGCVRLHNADMARLARLVPAGTPVIIST